MSEDNAAAPGRSQQSPGELSRQATAAAADLNELVVVDQAENVIGLARMRQLAASVQAASKRAARAHTELAQAELNGTFEQANNAREAAHTAAAEFGRLAEAAVREMELISQTRQAGISDVLGQIGRTLAAIQAEAAATLEPSNLSADAERDTEPGSRT